MGINNLNKLSLVATEELTKELGNRFDCFVFVAVNKLAEGRGEIVYDRKGNHFTQIGLIDYMWNRCHETEPRKGEF
jgi:hypothetical protein